MIVRTSSEIYLDANATTQVLPQAAKAARDVMEELYGNPSSSHSSGLRARNILESTRQLARKILGAETGQIVFTSGATEAIQMAVLSALCNAREQQSQGKRPAENRILMYGATEHKAVPQAIRHWKQLLNVNAEVVEIPVDKNGMLDLDFIEQNASRADLICTMAVNNETGVVCDLEEVESRIRGANSEVAWLVDCVQAIGKTELDFSKTTIDYATASGHKIFAPKGIGLLYARESAALVPLMAGGGQEQGARGGTENLPGVAAIGAVLQLLADSPSRSFADESVLRSYRQRLVDALKSAFPTIVFNAPFEHSVPCTINFAVKGFPSKELLDLFDAAGVRVSSGSACGSAAVNSYVLDAMGVEPWQSRGAIRMSFGAVATDSQITAACERIAQVGQALCDSCLVVATDADALASQNLNGLIQLKSGSNCSWLLMDSASRRCVVIDPFEEMAERIEALVRCQKSKVVAVLDTHAHVDHESCRKELLGALSQFAADSAATDDLLGWPQNADGECLLGDGTTAQWMRLSDELVIAKTDLPGHTMIGVAYFVGTLDGERLPAANIKFAFTGDMILMGGIGRTDFPCSSADRMHESLQRLPMLIGNQTLICPTHDYHNEFATTLDAEIAENDFLRSIVDPVSPMSLTDFKDAKPGIDAGIADESNSELVCGLIRRDNDSSNSLLLDQAGLRTILESDSEALIIDVREPHEFAFEQSWSELGFREVPRNVPLTRLSDFLPELMKTVGNSDQKVLFLCRSGKRSGKAAEVARRLGVANALSIVGGLALNTMHCSSSAKPDMEYMI
ncbi:aminotransferase class V-fold PLP-dependent enzyme [Mariniblastus fucicola]|uniref:cysteine desulfurase n=1 Tax=Mariniblastus fucicola TaxID=980251 RepID=A0A5B9PMJ9_9BACT|nr:aminotransferase class V-fold PLP-dependent enzyme [Mariniblastus fucicola]QEG23811.1 Cysteine desulfurase [Mariniblastus fucicola]